MQVDIREIGDTLRETAYGSKNAAHVKKYFFKNKQ